MIRPVESLHLQIAPSFSNIINIPFHISSQVGDYSMKIGEDYRARPDCSSRNPQ
jgi:hypothetical protein